MNKINTLKHWVCTIVAKNENIKVNYAMHITDSLLGSFFPH